MGPSLRYYEYILTTEGSTAPYALNAVERVGPIGFRFLAPARFDDYLGRVFVPNGRATLCPTLPRCRARHVGDNGG